MTDTPMPDPYCSTCKKPAQWRESIGVVHVTDEGRIIYPEEDKADHKPDLATWYKEYDRLAEERTNAAYAEGRSVIREIGKR